jgi:hypothetical protein
MNRARPNVSPSETASVYIYIYIYTHTHTPTHNVRAGDNPKNYLVALLPDVILQITLRMFNIGVVDPSSVYILDNYGVITKESV